MDQVVNVKGLGMSTRVPWLASMDSGSVVRRLGLENWDPETNFGYLWASIEGPSTNNNSYFGKCFLIF